MKNGRVGKYTVEQYLKQFRFQARCREKMIADGYSDNAGAIHSAERILHLLGLAIGYSEIGHQNNLRKWQHAQFSQAAKAAHQRGERVYIEHVNPHRALTCEAHQARHEGHKRCGADPLDQKELPDGTANG
jgi:hypothetical protein